MTRLLLGVSTPELVASVRRTAKRNKEINLIGIIDWN